MTFSQALKCTIVLLVIAFAHAKVTLSDFSGVWRGYFRNRATALLTPNGPAFTCVDTLPMKCAEQLPLTEDTYTINGTTIILEARDRSGITTVEQSSQRYPACAKDELYPIETTLIIPPSRIVSYDSKRERLYYIDPRRPEETNCLPFRYRLGDQGPYIEVEHSVTYQGSLENVFALGSNFVCHRLPQDCLIEVEGEELNVDFYNIFNITCIEGDCLDTVGPTAQSPSQHPTESQDDV